MEPTGKSDQEPTIASSAAAPATPTTAPYVDGASPRPKPPLWPQFSPVLDEPISTTDRNFGNFEKHLVFETDMSPEDLKFMTLVDNQDKFQWGQHINQGARKIRMDNQLSKVREKGSGVHIEGTPKRMSALEKLIKWSSWARSPEERKSKRIVLLRMGAPDGPQGEASLWAAKIRSVDLSLIIKKRMRGSVFLLETEVPCGRFAAEGQFSEYLAAIRERVYEFLERFAVSFTNTDILDEQSSSWYDSRPIEEIVEEVVVNKTQDQICEAMGTSVSDLWNNSNTTAQFNDSYGKIKLDLTKIERKRVEDTRRQIEESLGFCQSLVQEMQARGSLVDLSSILEHQAEIDRQEVEGSAQKQQNSEDSEDCEDIEEGEDVEAQLLQTHGTQQAAVDDGGDKLGKTKKKRKEIDDADGVELQPPAKKQETK
ncbi:hypothetical protein BS50DRAFT_636283 [Corynespora cassiicola Philippines]|uniref:Uncharacterized protein n=1 Tax=Corynespora cassiicola Philippines TaxID=1448308 RepID=A0A2T2NJE5_CORCC|nr:hypothetical protein BS50DRAFT_636283 [Corynespora cassiicola Philippines]